MGGTVNAEASTQSVETVARLQNGVRSDLPVMIPGARETRAAPAEPINVIADPVAASARAAAVFDRIRLEREPVSDAASHGRTRRMLARLWRRVYRGPDAAPVAVVK